MKSYVFGFIGVGHIGGQVARALVRAGHSVVLSNSRGPESLAELVKELGPAARATSREEAAQLGEIVVVAVPLKSVGEIPVAPLARKIVIGTTNYIAQYDGHIADLDSGKTTSGGLLQSHLPQSHVVKAFSHLSAAEVTTDGLPSGTANRRALAIAGDDADAKAIVSALYDQIGFDTVDVGPMSESWRLEMGQPAFITRQNAAELKANVALARRTT